MTFDPKEKIKLEAGLAKENIDQVSGLSGSVKVGPALEEYTQHLEKAVSLSTKLDPVTKTEIAPTISDLIQKTTPLLIDPNTQTSAKNEVSKVVIANQWAANQIAPNLSKPGLSPTALKVATQSALQKAIETQITATQATPKEISEANKPAGRSVHVPILMYHYVRVVDAKRDPLGYALSVTPDDLEAQTAYLEANGFHAVHPAALVAALKTGAALPSKPIMLTFDDSYRDFYTAALPILQRHHLIATNYTISDYVLNNYPAYMTVDMIKAINAAGMNIGAHTRTHPDLARQSPAVAADQIKGSKIALEGLIGKSVLDFAYPYGSFNQTTINLVIQSGYTNAVATIYGVNHSSGALYTLTRVRISGGDSRPTFINKVNQ